MANTTTSPNMSLVVPVVSTDPAPDWASHFVSCFSILDQHNHSSGSGVQITQAGISLTGAASTLDSLSFSGSNAYALRSVRFTAQASPLALATDLGCLYESGVDLYYNDGAGNHVRITSGGSVAGATGTITGLPSGTASAAYSAGTFIFQSATATGANIDGASYVFRNATASSFGLTLSPPNAMGANYGLTLPALPGSTSIMRLDTSGNMSATLGVDSSTIVISANTLQVPSSGIQTANIAAAAVTSAKLASNLQLTTTAGNSAAIVGPTNTGNLVVSDNFSGGGQLRVVRGAITSGGVITQGTGFTASRLGTGNYLITFTTAFADVPSVVFNTNSGNIAIPVVNSVNSSSANLSLYVAAGSATDQSLNFIAVGLYA